MSEAPVAVSLGTAEINTALDDRYAADSGRVFLSGTQALVRLPMMQRRRDEAAGLDTACLVTGYRGSPLGGARFWRRLMVIAGFGLLFDIVDRLGRDA